MKRLSLIIATIVLSLSYHSISAQDIIMAPGTQSVCAGTFLDPEGYNDYANSTDIEMTLCSATAGQEISITFNVFDTENNYDDLTIYQGTGTGGTLIGTYDGNDLQGQTIASTGSGCLTFVWHSDGSVTNPGWEADIQCVEACQQFDAVTTFNGGAFPNPIDLCAGDQIDVTAVGNYPNNDINYHQDDATSTFVWDFGNGTANTQNASNIYGTQGTYTLTLTITDVNGCTYIETHTVNVTCGGGCAPCTDIFPTDPDVFTCSGTFWDTGLNNNYSANENETITICPDVAGQAININFIEFNTDEWGDHMWIHNGNSIASPMITGLGGSVDDDYDGTELAGITVSSTSGDGCLTFVWASDGWTENSGWIGDISCTAGCQEIGISTTENGNAITGNIATCITTPIDFVSTITFPNNDINYHQDITTCTFHWDFGNGQTANTQDASVSYGSQGTYTVVYTVTDDNNCPTIQTYTVDVTCGGACPPCADITVDNPDVNTCIGTFWDTGMNAEYGNNEAEEITICPDAPGNAVNVNFIEFQTESCCDHMWIHDGNSTASPMIIGLGGSVDDDYDGTELAGITVTSTSGDGCLTFVWTSDGSVTNPGWKGDIFCSIGCQAADATTTANGAPIVGNITTCISDPIDFVPTVTFPNNDINYHQDLATCTFLWDFGNGTTSNTLNSSVTYNTQGTYTVTLTVTDDNNCPNIFTYTVDVTCGGACAPCTDIFPADPDVNTCVGTFWDSGLNNPYTTDENDTITICSDNGGFIQFHFNEFELDQWDNDKLIIYDGPDVNSPALGVYTTTNPPPTDIVSSGTCITFRFMSETWSTPGAGWAAEISCAEPCQDMELDVTSIPAADAMGTIHTCPGGSIDFSANVTFPNNDINYHQDMGTTVISWSAYNGATGTGSTFTLPADSSFTTEVMIDVIDINGCHVYDTIHVVSECQAVDVEIGTDATVMQSGEIYIPVGGSISFDGIYDFPENGDCYNQTLSEITWTFGFVDGFGDVIEYHPEDTVIQFPSSGVNHIYFEVTDQEGCSNETTVEVHVGCQPVDVTWTGTPAMLGDTIIVCPGDSFSIEIFTDYFANNSPYFQEDANMIFNWNMGDGTFVTNQMQPGFHTYTDAGVYNVYLQMVDTNSGNTVPCIDDTYIPIYAFMEPSFAGTGIATDTICFGDSLLLTGNTTLDMPSYSAPPVFLPDGSGVSYTSTLTFDIFGDEILTDVNDFISICLNMEHSYCGDLAISIICPNGQETEMLPYPNGLGNHFIGEPVDNTGGDIGTGYEYCFTPQANQTFQDVDGLFTYSYTDNIGTVYTDHEVVPAGEYAPTGTFDDLLGCPLNGDWVLQITDNIGADDGWIFDWSMTLNVDGLVPPDTTQLPLDMREWTVETGGDAIINLFDGDDAYATPIDTGIYTFTFTTTSPAGCSYNTTVGPLYVAPMPIWTLGNDTNLCASYDYTIPGTLTGGNGTWSYTGPGIATFSDLNTIPTDVTVDTYGDYTFYFTPNTIAMCADPDSILVSFHELPTVDAVIDSLTCYQVCDGEVTVTPTGIELPYYYNWSNSDTTTLADSLCSGDHQLIVTTDFCTNSYNYFVPEPTEVLIVDSGIVDNLCFDDDNGQVWISVEGGTPGYTYTWDASATNDSIIIGLADGSYNVTVADNNGCQKTATLTVNGPIAPLTIVSIEPTNISCSDENNGALDLLVEGGTIPYTYSWVLASSNTSTVEDPTGLMAGTHDVTVTDANGCVTSGSQTISEPTELIVQAFVEPTSCYGYSDGKAWVTTSQGTPPYQYEWSTGVNDSVIINSPALVYSVTVTDDRGCFVVKEMEVEQPLDVMLSIVPTSTICIGESTDLTMSVTSSPYAPYTYLWNGVVSAETITVNPQETTTYTAQAIDSHGCESAIIEEVVQVYDPITTNFTTDKTEICAGEVVTVNLSPQGGNGNYNYTTLDGIIVSETFTVQPEETKTYKIIVGDNCTLDSDTIEFSITVWGTYNPSFHADYKQGCSPLTVNFYQDIQSHNEGTTYLWGFGDESSSSISFDPAPTHIFNAPGSYNISLEITTPKGCKSEKIEYEYIVVHPVPTASFSATPSVTSIIEPNIYFENYSVGGSIWHWDFGDGDSTFAWNIEHTYPNFSNEYSVTLVAISNYGCSDSITNQVRIVDEVTFHIPTGFSPDGDGKNEVFRPYGNALSDEGYSMIIYDRWGEIVFESTEIDKGWDGKIKEGKRGTLGMYTYVIRFVDTYGVPHERSGYVNLVR